VKIRTKTLMLATVIMSILVVLPSVRIPPSSAVSSSPLHSDFNGDGYDDLAIGVPHESIGTITAAGAVNVLYGSSGGLQADSPDDQVWHQNKPGIRGTCELSDYFGRALAVGDFNNDNYDDLAIGVPYESIGTIEIAGAVNVLYGSSAGLQADSPDDQRWHQNTPGVRDTCERNDNFGWALSVGDFNNDGYDDLAIGVRYEDIGTIGNAGAVNVLYGSSTGLQADSPDDQVWHQNKPGVREACESGDYFGYSLGVGDFFNDGYDDLAIGVPYESIGTIDAGAVNVLYGSSAGLQADSPDDQLWHQNKPGVKGVCGYYEHFGAALAFGDFNNDNYDDLAIGVPYEDIGTIERAGAVNILYWHIHFFTQRWHQNKPGVRGTCETNDYFGRTLTGQ